LGDHGDGNIIDINLVFLDQMEQQIQRSLEILDTDLVGQFGLLETLDLMIHRAGYTSLWGGGQARIYMWWQGREAGP
jgi:hypothetical protein